MSLDVHLEQARRGFLSKLSEEKAAVIAVAENRLRSSGILSRVLRAGDRAPNVRVGQGATLAELAAQGPLVLSFIQGGWSPFCQAELTAWQRLMPYVQALGVRLVILSPQLPEENARLRAELGLDFDLVGDTESRVAQAFGAAYVLPRTLRTIYLQLGFDLPRFNGGVSWHDASADSAWTLPVPATFVIGPDAVIHTAFADTDLSRRMEPMDALLSVSDMLEGPVPAAAAPTQASAAHP